MRQVISKVYLDEGPGLHKVLMPKGAELLFAGGEGTKVAVWFRGDETPDSELRYFVVVPPNQFFNATVKKYLGTIQFQFKQDVGGLILPGNTKLPPGMEPVMTIVVSVMEVSDPEQAELIE